MYHISVSCMNHESNMSGLSLTSFAPLILCLACSLLVYNVQLSWRSNKSSIASLERARSDLRRQMDNSQDCHQTLRDVSRSQLVMLS